MLRTFSAWALTAALSILPGNSADSADPALLYSAPQPKADGYRGIWYFNQPSDDQYKYKYSGGFATYPQLTPNSERNHTYARRPVNAHPDFYAIWADGDAWQPSESNLYFTDRAGSRVWRLPGKMTADLESPRSPGKSHGVKQSTTVPEVGRGAHKRFSPRLSLAKTP